MSKNIGFLFFGTFFGFVLSRVGASDFNLIYGMFIGENLKLVGVIGTAIIVAYVGMQSLRKQAKQTRTGQSLEISKKKLTSWSLSGALIFGLGWGMAGACPGTVLAQLGEGKIFAVFTLAGITFGTYLYALLKEKQPNL
ncbi:MAG: YeeE/YedE family protein [Firmicutes bacterium]|nr:YeeE/YedE family protein [Bacillota bacterium]